MESYDESEVMREQVKPLSDQIFTICKEHQIPIILIGASKAEVEGPGVQTTFFEMAYLPGMERTPTIHALIASLIEQDYAAAMMLLLTLMGSDQGPKLASEPAPTGTLLN